MTRPNVRRRLRTAAARSGTRSAPRLLGCWDAPGPDDLPVGNAYQLSGWVVSTRRGSSPHVLVQRDGLTVAEARPSFARPDVFDNLGVPAARGHVGWSVSVATEASDAGAVLEVIAYDGTDRVSLGSRRLRQPHTSALAGRLDLPNDSTTVHAGGTLRVAGWACFDGEPADTVEVFVGDAPAVPVRAGLPRPDVADALGRDEAPKALACGYSDLIAIPEAWSGARVDVVVRARSLAGSEWVSETVGLDILPLSVVDEDFDEFPSLQLPARVQPASGDHRPRLCVFTHSLRLGGGELYLQELVLRLVRDHDFDVLVVSPIDGPLKQQLRDAGVAVHLTRHYATNPANYLGGVRELAALLCQWNADAVLVNTLGIFPGADAGAEVGLPVFWAIHESFSLETFACLNWGAAGLHPEVHERWLRCLAESSTIFESHATLEMFERAAPKLQGRVVRYGIELSGIERYRRDHDRDAARAELGFGPDVQVLLCMGVFQERKAQLGLVLAFAEVAHEHPDAHLVLVGYHPSDYSDAVTALVERLGLEDRISIEPIQPDTYLWYLVADVLVSASDTESLPRSVLEAMAFGLPTLAADVFGLSEVVKDGENGWLCRAHSRGSLIAGLKRVLLTSKEERAALSRRCESDALAFDGANYAAEYATMIRESIGATASSGGHRTQQ